MQSFDKFLDLLGTKSGHGQAELCCSKGVVVVQSQEREAFSLDGNFGSFGCVRLPKDFGLGWVLVYYYIKHSLHGCAVENRAQMEADLTDICSNFED